MHEASPNLLPSSYRSFTIALPITFLAYSSYFVARDTNTKFRMFLLGNKSISMTLLVYHGVLVPTDSLSVHVRFDCRMTVLTTHPTGIVIAKGIVLLCLR